jgi:hypothetical protein
MLLYTYIACLVITLHDSEVAARIFCLYKTNVGNLKVYENWLKYFQLLKTEY